MAKREELQNNNSNDCKELVQKFIGAIYRQDGEQLLETLSQGSKQYLLDSNITCEGQGLTTLAKAIHHSWNCPRDKVLVQAPDFDHPHLQGRVRVPVILDFQDRIPQGYILPEGAPLPSSCGVLGFLLTEAPDGWKVDNIQELIPHNCLTKSSRQ